MQGSVEGVHADNDSELLSLFRSGEMSKEDKACGK